MLGRKVKMAHKIKCKKTIKRNIGMDTEKIIFQENKSYWYYPFDSSINCKVVEPENYSYRIGFTDEQFYDIFYYV